MLARFHRTAFAASVALASGCGATAGAARVDEPLSSEGRALGPATLKAKLVAELARGHDGARCAYAKLGQRGGEVYVWALCEAFDGARVVWAVSQPAVVAVDWSAGAVVSIRVPGDGDQYPKDAEKLFPESLQSVVLQRDIDGANRRVRALEEALARE